MTAADRLDAIEARANAATEGPWAMWDGWGPTHDGLMGFARLGPNAPGGLFTFPDARDLYASRTDAEFIANARTDVPALVAALRGVLGLHEPRIAAEPMGRRPHIWRCNECRDFLGEGDRPQHPCPTVAAITAALAPAVTR